MRALYGTAVFASAFLLFLIEPIAAKEILPALGGSSSVWITCLVFFQAMLVVGYLYAHWLGRESLTRGVVKIAPAEFTWFSLPRRLLLRLRNRAFTPI